MLNECAHDWAEGEIECYCELTFHPCVYCENCETLVDLLNEPDPREI